MEKSIRGMEHKKSITMGTAFVDMSFASRVDLDRYTRPGEKKTGVKVRTKGLATDR